MPRENLSVWRSLLCFVALAGCLAARTSRADEEPRPANTRIFAHVMPWFEADPAREFWGWHWTMNAFDPRDVAGGRRRIAAKLYPAIGPYDSGDPHVIEYQLLLMKLAGIDGIIVDWYGREDFNDYALLHRNTTRLVECAGQFGLEVAICYEDRTILDLVKAGRLAADARAAHAAREIAWLARTWFPLEHYARLDGRPLLLSFGADFLSDAEWTACLAVVDVPLAYVSQQRRRTAAVGGFDWPLPDRGLAATAEFRRLSAGWPVAIPVAFPRFLDIYAEAGVHPSYGHIPDDGGRTFTTTLATALESAPPIVQIATWNDWGEGTVVEPSLEYGTRDLEVVQRLRRRLIEPGFAVVPEALQLPGRLLELRRSAPPAARRDLDAAVAALVRGDLALATRHLDTAESR